MATCEILYRPNPSTHKPKPRVEFTSGQVAILTEILKDSTVSITEISDDACDSVQVPPATTNDPFESSASDDLARRSQQTSGVDICCNDTIQRTFQNFQHQWISDPIIDEWRNPNHRIYDILAEVNKLHKTWTSQPPRPFDAYSDPLWRETGQVLADVGLPWHNNQVGMPDELDSSWQFHFKSFEQQLIKTKGGRVGDPNAVGYVADASEANCYCIRALQQEIREKVPSARPILVYDQFDEKVILSVAQFLGLEVHNVPLSNAKSSHGFRDAMAHFASITAGYQRPVIFAATLANSNSAYDDLNIICKLSEIDQLTMLLHLDASRSFDFITTISESCRRMLGTERFKLQHKSPMKGQSLRLHDGSITVSTIVAGGAHHSGLATAVALKPALLARGQQMRISYVRTSDSTLSGSRDALAPLRMALQEIRFGEAGFQKTYQYCIDMRTALLNALVEDGFASQVVTVSPYSPDLIIRLPTKEQRDRLESLGCILTDTGDAVMTFQPSIQFGDLRAVREIITGSIKTVNLNKPCRKDFSLLYRVPEPIIEELKATVHSWRIATRYMAGYPLHMGSYSALGPVVGRFLDVNIPTDWIKTQKNIILNSRMRDFGLTSEKDTHYFKGAFTNGTTMGNRMGLHAALKRLPGAHVYLSEETHYSVPKTMRDCDTLTNRWSYPAREQRYSRIPCDSNGSISVEALAKKALADKEGCARRGEEYHMILCANMGTTFVGARDNLSFIYTKLGEVGIQISHIHVDGALELGFGNSAGLKLGEPGAVDEHGVPFVQAVTFSHHKAMGNMVSGEIICFSPGEELSSLEWDVDPMVIFETWLFKQVYTPVELDKTLHHCQKMASLLECGLRKLGLMTKRNSQSIIVVLERPPAWIIEEFSLRPEDDWVHFITMPHISPEVISLFLERISSFQKQYLTAFKFIQLPLNSIMEQTVKLKPLEISLRKALANQLEDIVTRSKDDNLTGSIRAGVRSITSVVILGPHNQIEGLLCLEPNRDTSIKVGPLLLRSCHASCRGQVIDVASQLVGLIAKNLNAHIHIDASSYRISLNLKKPKTQRPKTAELVNDEPEHMY
ncbi:hypothetical protein TWF694_011128 [Orbilia ellipsospora]|uniref:Pyridoxal phosphate-dependent transferase n=1 Tax=Orbilia ellipsospora TaxID=2528407 RepID=A0AAV9X920_9PEZI